MDHGRIQQVGRPREIYEHPVNEFVMSFVGPVNRLSSNRFVRPHDIELRAEPNGITSEATVLRLVHLGFEVRVELTLQDGEHFSVQLTREQVDELELKEGQIVFVRPRETKSFADGMPAPVGEVDGDGSLQVEKAGA
jgi:sulfate transport system ATP-binding protein